jgi:hypothetical protein
MAHERFEISGCHVGTGRGICHHGPGVREVGAGAELHHAWRGRCGVSPLPRRASSPQQASSSRETLVGSRGDVSYNHFD